MERVIGEYGDFASAQDAVRGLEKASISIQNVIIVDQHLQMGRRLLKESSDARPRRRFLVVMRGEEPALASAATLLSQLSANGAATHADLPQNPRFSTQT